MLQHEDFIAQFFTTQNEAAVCAALRVGDLHTALAVFEDTRTAQQVNEMCAMLQAVTQKLYNWDDEEECYYIV